MRSLAQKGRLLARTESTPYLSSVNSSNACASTSFSDRISHADRRCRIAPTLGISLLLKNILLSREPLYGIGEWAARFVPEALGFTDSQLPPLNDDRIGRCLDRLFQSDITSLVLALVAHVIKEFDVDLDELHNDSTTITFHGAYADAGKEEMRGKRTRMAITWGYNKDHRPDLKQLLYILTVAKDGAVPLYFQVASGNVADDQTHRTTWDLLCRLTGRRDFLYVADCKLASAENMAHIHQRQGRFLTVCPGLGLKTVPSEIYSAVGRSSGGTSMTSEMTTVRSWTSIRSPSRLRSASKDTDWFGITVRAGRGQDCLCASSTGRKGPDRIVGAAFEALISADPISTRSEGRGCRSGNPRSSWPQNWIVTEIKERTEEKFRQDRRGRPNDKTRYVKKTSTRFELMYHIDHERLVAETAGDGVFPLITNDHSLSGLEMLLAYKGQPAWRNGSLT